MCGLIYCIKSSMYIYVKYICKQCTSIYYSLKNIYMCSFCPVMSGHLIYVFGNTNPRSLEKVSDCQNEYIHVYCFIDRPLIFDK